MGFENDLLNRLVIKSLKIHVSFGGQLTLYGFQFLLYNKGKKKHKTLNTFWYILLAKIYTV